MVIMCTTLAVDIPNVMMTVPASLGRPLSDILRYSLGQSPNKVTSMRPGANSIATVEWLHLGSTPSGTGIWNGTDRVPHVLLYSHYYYYTCTRYIIYVYAAIMPRACAHDVLGEAVENASCCDIKRYGEAKEWL